MDTEYQMQALSNHAPRRLSQKTKFIIAICILVMVGIIAFSGTKNSNATPKPDGDVAQKPPTPTPDNDAPFGTYASPKIPKKDVYIIFMIGDSMTEALGPHGGKLNEFINELYQSSPGNQKIVIANYAKGSTNILGLHAALNQKTTTGDVTFEPLLSRPFDLILVESFGYNPLSQLGLQEGLKKQTQTLDGLMKTLTTTHPDSAIIFVATIAPNKATYAQEASLGNTLDEREGQAEERMEYIKNHIAYAKDHNIPIIDIYNKSLTANGDGDPANINPNDHIHPSFKGIVFISQKIANFIYENQILPR